MTPWTAAVVACPLQAVVDDDYAAGVEPPTVGIGPLAWTLPGQGAPGADCGRERPMRCACCAHAWTGVSHCMMRECPTCATPWRTATAAEAAWRLRTAARVAFGRPVVAHVIVSFPPDTEITPDNVHRYRARAMRLLRRAGAYGGCLMLHPWRDQQERGHYTETGPHFHGVAIFSRGSKIAMGSNHYYTPVGTAEVVLKVLRPLRDYVAVKDLVTYQLGHAGIAPGRHALTWWGIVSRSIYRDTDPTWAPYLCEREDWEPTCPACGSRDVEERVDDEHGAYWITRRRWRREGVL